jgi:hypothetical protein
MNYNSINPRTIDRRSKPMFNFKTNQALPSGDEIGKALEDLAEAATDPSAREKLRQRVLYHDAWDKGLGGIILVVLTALDDRRTGPKDMALKKLVAMAGLGTVEICEKMKEEVGTN